MIDVALTPAETRPAAVAVVIDVLRATSTATQALASGYEAVLCTDSIARARELRGAGRVLAGEQDCVRPPDFDQGNSPLEALNCRGEELVLATTNGTPAVLGAARVAPSVLLACLLNLGAVAEELRDRHLPDDLVQLVCSGSAGALALEDVYVAGRLCALLPGPRTDAVRVAEAVARSYPSSSDVLNVAAHTQNLVAAGMVADLEYCCRGWVLSVVPRVLEVQSGVATVGLTDPVASVKQADRLDRRALPTQ